MTMKVSVQTTLPHDEFARRFGPIVGSSYDEAHAALLRAQGIKPVAVDTEYSLAPEAPLVAPVQPVQALPAPKSETDQPMVDLTPLYGIFIQLADALTETRERLEKRTVEQDHTNQFLIQALDEVRSRVRDIENTVIKVVDEPDADAA